MLSFKLDHACRKLMSKVSLTIFIRQLLGIEFHQLKAVRQTPLVCFVSGNTLKINPVERDTEMPHRIVFTISHCDNVDKTYHLHKLCHTRESALLERCPPPLISTDGAFPNHLSAKCRKMIRIPFNTIMIELVGF